MYIKAKGGNNELCPETITIREKQTREVLRYLEEHKGGNMYDIHIKLDIPRSSLYYILKKLEKENKISTKLIIGKGNRTTKLIELNSYSSQGISHLRPSLSAADNSAALSQLNGDTENGTEN